MAYFECTIGGASGDGVALIVQCDANFAGSTITADNGEDVFTETCPSVSPYTVRFEGIPTGTYTISGVSQGQTFTTQFTVLDYETTLNATPEGTTVLPINDIQIWLHCANIWDKNYTTISQVLADTTTLLALVSSNNAVDYMARSTSWASSVCANQTAMGYIGNNDYCANKLLTNSTWRTAICNSTYFESVLNVKVPTMTNNTTPSGECFSSTVYYSREPYLAFNNNSSNYWSSNATTDEYIGYDFGSAVIVNKCMLKPFSAQSSSYTYTVKIQGSNTSKTNGYVDLTDNFTIEALQDYNIALNNPTAYRYYRLYCVSGVNNINIAELQFYGRA